MNAASVTQIVSACPDLPVQIGGGIRNMDIAKQSTRPLCYPLRCHIYWIIRKHRRIVH
jgi:phosphoribosylformimino-5-aminoimidazole carboxamide ribonucleotide (ProFAR) isomerase